MTAKARNTTRNPALPRPGRWRAARRTGAGEVPALEDLRTAADIAAPQVADTVGDPAPSRQDAAERSGAAAGATDNAEGSEVTAGATDAGKPATGPRAFLASARGLPSRLARPITGRVSAVRRKSDIPSAPDAKGASWIRLFPSPVPRSMRADDLAEHEDERGEQAPAADNAGRVPGGLGSPPRASDGARPPRRGWGPMRLGRKPRASRSADRVPVRHRVVRAVGAAASALPESRAVRVGTAVADLVAANQGAINAGLAAASAVPVLRPYVKVAATAMGAVAVARRVARARHAAADVAAAFRGPGPTEFAHAGNGFGLGTPPGVPAQPDPATEEGGERRSPNAGPAPADAAPSAPQPDDAALEEVDPPAALQPVRRRDAGEPHAPRDAGTNTERGREP